jgi:hypothetical protein
VTALPPDILIRIAGEDQAVRRAGPWPQAGSFAMRMAAAEHATIEARRTGDILIRFNQRYRFWEHPDAWERASPQLDRLATSRGAAARFYPDYAVGSLSGSDGASA